MSTQNGVPLEKIQNIEIPSLDETK